ncbi:hypothetical protein CDD82_5533 [Ophiocordyceps australis]|uniref:Uncharacterized protein n=1 Tax=Ophiocordyceps australis TaxID=1399860 RepID=A0A2C5Y5H0_9HYPO|nr:hypothetical protein CDD82_5533 [Ophiocordyceps australis]
MHPLSRSALPTPSAPPSHLDRYKPPASRVMASAKVTPRGGASNNATARLTPMDSSVKLPGSDPDTMYAAGAPPLPAMAKAAANSDISGRFNMALPNATLIDNRVTAQAQPRPQAGVSQRSLGLARTSASLAPGLTPSNHPSTPYGRGHAIATPQSQDFTATSITGQVQPGRPMVHEAASKQTRDSSYGQNQSCTINTNRPGNWPLVRGQPTHDLPNLNQPPGPNDVQGYYGICDEQLGGLGQDEGGSSSYHVYNQQSTNLFQYEQQAQFPTPSHNMSSVLCATANASDAWPNLEFSEEQLRAAAAALSEMQVANNSAEAAPQQWNSSGEGQFTQVAQEQQGLDLQYLGGVGEASNLEEIFPQYYNEQINQDLFNSLGQGADLSNLEPQLYVPSHEQDAGLNEFAQGVDENANPQPQLSLSNMKEPESHQEEQEDPLQSEYPDQATEMAPALVGHLDEAACAAAPAPTPAAAQDPGAVPIQDAALWGHCQAYESPHGITWGPVDAARPLAAAPGFIEYPAQAEPEWDPQMQQQQQQQQEQQQEQQQQQQGINATLLPPQEPGSEEQQQLPCQVHPDQEWLEQQCFPNNPDEYPQAYFDEAFTQNVFDVQNDDYLYSLLGGGYDEAVPFQGGDE